MEVIWKQVRNPLKFGSEKRRNPSVIVSTLSALINEPTKQNMQEAKCALGYPTETVDEVFVKNKIKNKQLAVNIDTNRREETRSQTKSETVLIIDDSN